MANFFIVVGDDGFDLDLIADQLREQIPGLPPDQPQLAKKVLAVQTGVLEALVVVRGHENPHTHPDADLIFTLLEGSGWLQRSAEPDPATNIEISAGGTVVVPKGVCHAFHNTCETDSVLLATFSPGKPTAADGCASTATDSLADPGQAAAQTPLSRTWPAAVAGTLWRRWAVCFAAAPRRCPGIASSRRLASSPPALANHPRFQAGRDTGRRCSSELLSTAVLTHATPPARRSPS